jgi:hypothetical protein
MGKQQADVEDNKRIGAGDLRAGEANTYFMGGIYLSKAQS